MNRKYKNYVILGLSAIFILFFNANAVLADTTTITVGISGDGMSGLKTVPFTIPPGFISARIIDGGLDDRGPVKINGTDVFFACSNGASGCPENNGFWVLPSAACVAANQVPKPFDITSLVHEGANTLEAVIENCGGFIGGISFNIEIITNPCLSTTCDTPGFCQTLPGRCELIGGAAVCKYALDPNPCDADGDVCTADTCDSTDDGITAFCAAGPNTCGGIVPCGRLADNPSTPWKDDEPCNFCHLALTVQLLIEFLLKIAGIVALLAIVLGGFLYMISAGNAGNMSAAKKGIEYALVGFTVLFIAWTVVTTTLAILGYINPLGGSWYMMCSVT